MPDPSDDEVLAVLSSAPAEAVARLRAAVVAYLSVSAPLVTWREGHDPAGAAAGSAYPVYDDRVWDLLSALHAVGAVVAFDWMHWKRGAAARDDRLVRSASVADLARLVTVLLRGERFADGVIAGAVEAGTLPVLAERLLDFLAARAAARGMDGASSEVGGGR